MVIDARDGNNTMMEPQVKDDGGEVGVALAAGALGLVGLLLLLLLLLLLVYCCRQGQVVGRGRGEEKVTMMEEWERREERGGKGEVVEERGKERSSVCDLITNISSSWAASAPVIVEEEERDGREEQEGGREKGRGVREEQESTTLESRWRTGQTIEEGERRRLGGEEWTQREEVEERTSQEQRNESRNVRLVGRSQDEGQWIEVERREGEGWQGGNRENSAQVGQREEAETGSGEVWRKVTIRKTGLTEEKQRNNSRHQTAHDLSQRRMFEEEKNGRISEHQKDDRRQSCKKRERTGHKMEQERGYVKEKKEYMKSSQGNGEMEENQSEQRRSESGSRRTEAREDGEEVTGAHRRGYVVI